VVVFVGRDKAFQCEMDVCGVFQNYLPCSGVTEGFISYAAGDYVCERRTVPSRVTKLDTVELGTYAESTGRLSNSV
jgi:hypothetical protein